MRDAGKQTPPAVEYFFYRKILYTAGNPKRRRALPWQEPFSWSLDQIEGGPGGDFYGSKGQSRLYLQSDKIDCLNFGFPCYQRLGDE